MDAKNRATPVRLIAFDIDGVMTNGGLHYTDDSKELKTFDVQDGLGIKLLQNSGIEVAIVTGRKSGVVASRAEDLGIEHIHQGVGDKFSVMSSLTIQLGLSWRECAFMGDDLIDLKTMAACGLAIAPANARPIAKQFAHYVTTSSGGSGAVREAAEFILVAQNKLDAAFAPYLPEQ